jgi:SAM-dependent methyltransferase
MAVRVGNWDDQDLSEYSDPERYDTENPAFEPDGPFYRELARASGGPVIELGCGTGRLTIPIGQAGVEVVGLDVVPAMLERARSKPGGETVAWVLADARTFELDLSAALIFIAAGGFGHFHTAAEQRAVLERVRAHLRPGGRFALDLLCPRPDLLVAVPNEEPWFAYTRSDGAEVRVSGTQRFDAVRRVRHETAVRRWTDCLGNQVEQVSDLALRLFEPDEIVGLLGSHGFSVESRFGGWGGEPLDADTQQLVVVCRNAD